uniref:Uncharacterized protein n=1 Tax=Rousettus aegyptiacus TaxID=9407 RepID=A0A7J8CHK0_ROUAE|nr:hypothetical protein HJG63_008910 [Rousettus aegyptiacus]
MCPHTWTKAGLSGVTFQSREAHGRRGGPKAPRLWGGGDSVALRTLGVASSELPRVVNEGSCGEGHPGDPHGRPPNQQCSGQAGESALHWLVMFSQVTVCPLPWLLGWSAGFARPLCLLVRTTFL